MNALDDLPDDQLAQALDVLGKLRRGERFHAPYGTPQGLAVVNLLRFGLAEIVAPGTAGEIPVRLKSCRPVAG